MPPEPQTAYMNAPPTEPTCLPKAFQSIGNVRCPARHSLADSLPTEPTRCPPKALPTELIDRLKPITLPDAPSLQILPAFPTSPCA